MNDRTKLLLYPNLYDHTHTDSLFVSSMRKNIEFHRRHCKDYEKILAGCQVKPQMIRKSHDLSKIPPLPTTFLKTHSLWSMNPKQSLLNATSSGTGGQKSQIGYDCKSLAYAAVMAAKTAQAHHLISTAPTNYLILGYEPHPGNQTMISKTQSASRLYAPFILHTEYALSYTDGDYHLNVSGVMKALEGYAGLPFPVRLIGFPAYAYFLLQALKQAGKHFCLPKGSRLILGGGWKQFYNEQVDKQSLFRLTEEILGIPSTQCHEFFGAAEHPVVYCSCKNHHFHVPAYSRVIIRDVQTLKPLKYGNIGLLNLLTPMAENMPLSSIMTDDLAVLHEGRACGCGITTPYFEIMGRIGMKEIKTCAATAQAFL